MRGREAGRELVWLQQTVQGDCGFLVSLLARGLSSFLSEKVPGIVAIAGDCEDKGTGVLLVETLPSSRTVRALLTHLEVRTGGVLFNKVISVLCAVQLTQC